MRTPDPTPPNLRTILGRGRLKWWAMTHLPGLPIARCAECGRLFRRHPWWWPNPFEEQCSRACADAELDRLCAPSQRGVVHE